MAPPSQFQKVAHPAGQGRSLGSHSLAATWEDPDSFQDWYPTFQLEDELLVEGGEM